MSIPDMSALRRSLKESRLPASNKTSNETPAALIYFVTQIMCRFTRAIAPEMHQ